MDIVGKEKFHTDDYVYVANEESVKRQRMADGAVPPRPLFSKGRSQAVVNASDEGVVNAVVVLVCPRGLVSDGARVMLVLCGSVVVVETTTSVVARTELVTIGDGAVNVVVERRIVNDRVPTIWVGEVVGTWVAQDCVRGSTLACHGQACNMKRGGSWSGWTSADCATDTC